MKTKRIVFIGTINFSEHCLKELLSLKAKVVGVFAKKASTFHSDHANLWPIAKKAGIPIYDVDNINDVKTIQQIKQLSPDVIFCFGWSQLFQKELLALAPMGVIGVHPAALPANRGRHPLIWALVLGLPSSALTFFKMDGGADSGPIVAQAAFKITYQDDAATLYSKIEKLASKLLKLIVKDLEQGKWRLKIQKSSGSNNWRKRGAQDGQIDWRMSSYAIYNLVRALAKPYPGAHCMVNDKPVKIFKVKEQNSKLINREPGQVLAVKGKRILVKTYDGAVELIDHEFTRLPKTGDYL